MTDRRLEAGEALSTLRAHRKELAARFPSYWRICKVLELRSQGLTQEATGAMLGRAKNPSRPVTRERARQLERKGLRMARWIKDREAPRFRLRAVQDGRACPACQEAHGRILDRSAIDTAEAMREHRRACESPDGCRCGLDALGLSSSAYYPLRPGIGIGMDTRLVNSLMQGGYFSLSDALAADPEDLMGLRNFGRRCLEHLNQLREGGR